MDLVSHLMNNQIYKCVFLHRKISVPLVFPWVSRHSRFTKKLLLKYFIRNIFVWVNVLEFDLKIFISSMVICDLWIVFSAINSLSFVTTVEVSSRRRILLYAESKSGIFSLPTSLFYLLNRAIKLKGLFMKW